MLCLEWWCVLLKYANIRYGSVAASPNFVNKNARRKFWDRFDRMELDATSSIDFVRNDLGDAIVLPQQDRQQFMVSG